MKLLWVCFLAFGLSFVNQIDEHLIINDEKVELILNSNVKKEDLKVYKEKLKEVDIRFVVKKAKYYPLGGLRSISFKVSYGTEGNKGSAEHKILTRNSKFGFIINFDPNAEIAFRVGSLD